MKFRGELKFPEVDHPGVPVTFLIEESQAELVVEGESLGRWSLYDIHARRLVANAFQIDLEGLEVTFVADDPVDFAYRGVEHMAETWATLKSMRIARRSLAVRRSRNGTKPSRVGEMMGAMEENLAAQSRPRQIAGEEAMPEPAPPETDLVTEPGVGTDWDTRETGSIPMASAGGSDVSASSSSQSAPVPEGLSDSARHLEEEKRRIAEERATLEEERRLAEQREADRIEAYRLEMQRLEAEREELRTRAAHLADESDAHQAVPASDTEPEPASDAGPEPVSDAGPERAAATEPEGSKPASPVVDLNDFEDEPEFAPALDRDKLLGRLQPEPQLAEVDSGTGKAGGLMGAVRSAFRSSTRDHDHQFIEAPGGMGITRYVCEECGFVSISG